MLVRTVLIVDGSVTMFYSYVFRLKLLKHVTFCRDKHQEALRIMKNRGRGDVQRALEGHEVRRVLKKGQEFYTVYHHRTADFRYYAGS
jgi:hypothetical protein